MAGPNVGFATLSIIPSASGFAQAISGEIGAPMAKAAKDQGGKSGSGFMSGFGSKAKVAALAVGTAVAAVLAKGIADAMEIGAANDKLAAQLGLNEQQAEAFGRAAGNLYSQAYGDSIGQVNDALAAVSSTLEDSLGNADDALETTTAKALDLASAFDLDVGEAVSAAGVLFKSGLAENADEAFDLLTRGLQEMPAAIRGELLEASNEYGTFFDTLGFTGEQTFKLLTDAAESGIYGIDKTGDAIKEFTIRATDLSAASKDAYDRIGVSAEDMTNKILAGGDEARGAFSQIVDGLLSVEDPGKRAEAAIALFGTPLEDLNVTEIPAFLESLSGMTEGLGGVDGAASALGDTLNDNAATKIEAFKRQALMGVAEVVAEYVIPALESFAAWVESDLVPKIETAYEALTDAAEFVMRNWDKFKYAAGVMVAVVGAAFTRLAVMAAVSAAKQVASFLLAGAQAIWTAAVYTAQVAIMVGRWAFLAARSVVHAAVVVASWVATQTAAGRATAGHAIAVATQSGGWAALATNAARSAGAIAASWARALGPMALVIAGAESINRLTGNKLNPNNLSLWDRLDPRKAFKGLDIGFDIPFFDSGGTMPGPRGVHSLAWVAGGETVLPTHRSDFDGGGSRVTLDVTGGSDDLVRLVQKWVRTNGGGDVQVLAGR